MVWRCTLVDNLKIIQLTTSLILLLGIGSNAFAQVNDESSAQTQQVEKSIPIDKKAGPSERLSLVLGPAKSYCASRNPYPLGADSNGQDTQICKRLEIRGKRIECEINQVGQKNAKGDVFGPEMQSSLKDWAQCTGKVALILEQGFYLPSGEIERRLQFCNNQFMHHPGEAPQLGFMERLRKNFARPDYKSQTDPAIDKAFFDKSNLQIDDQRVGISKCEYMIPSATNPPVLKNEINEANKPIVIENINKNSDTEIKNQAKKNIPIPQTKISKVELDSKESLKKKEELKKKAELKKKEELKNASSVGECRRPLKDCPK
jgi:hypothetical protein